jgi:uncharacterized membrane protein/fucose permease
MNAADLTNPSRYAPILLVVATGFLQGLTLVSFPALGSILKTTLNLSDTSYGAIYLPQVALTAAGAVAGGLLALRLGLPALLRLSLIANSLSQIALLTGAGLGGTTGVVWVFLGTSFLGLGFGLSAAPLNRYPALFFPAHSDSAIAALHTFIGIGLAAGPFVVGMLAAMNYWQAFSVALVLLTLLILLFSLPLHFPADNVEAVSGSMTETGELMQTPAFWLLFATAAVYAVCEGLFSNWAVIFLQEDKQIGPKEAGVALSAFWAALALGRLLTSWLVLRLPVIAVWLGFPVLIACAFWLLTQIDSAVTGIAVYSLAGLACSGFFPLTVSRASSRFPQQAALVSSLMIAALMMGVGLGSFTLGALRNLFSLSTVFQGAVLLPLLLMGMALLAFIRPRPAESSAEITSTNPVHFDSAVPEGIVICPACGGENREDAIFCGNHQCHKALGGFRYVLEELSAQKSWIEKLADRVSVFVSTPHFITLHVFWFSVWILANEGYLGRIQHFDEYPYDLLGIVLSIEAILITGFLLISQNYQYDYSEKRAELDYEINIRTYRKLIELEKRLETQAAKASGEQQ